MKRIEFWLRFVCSLAASVAFAATATTAEFRLSLKEDAIRDSAGEETLRCSPIWDGGSNETASVTLKQGETTLADGLLDEGDYSWSVTKPGTYVLTHTTHTNSTLAKTLTATFMVSGVPFPAGSVTATGYNGKFDGKGYGITVTTTGIEYPSITYARAQSGPYVETNPLFTNVCSETVWCVVSADGYIPQTNSASVVITDGEIVNPFDPDDPTKPVAIPTATTDELGLRNVFTSKDKTDKAIAEAVLAIWKGTYVMAYPEIDEDGVTNGWNTFSIKIGTRGRTIVAGILASGKSVSASAQMLVGDEWCKIAVSTPALNSDLRWIIAAKEMAGFLPPSRWTFAPARRAVFSRRRRYSIISHLRLERGVIIP